MTYGGSFPLGWNQSPSDWREWQWQLYQESLAEEEQEQLAEEETFWKNETCDKHSTKMEVNHGI